MHFAPGSAGNLLRGALGKNLKNLGGCAYDRWFAPASLNGPSGLRDKPRPFVLRAVHLEGAVINSGSPFCVGLNVFDPRAVDDLSRALTEFAPLDSIDGRQLIRLSLAARQTEKVRVTFLTPTELKGVDRPDFAVLWARVRDRISTLRALYGSGPLAIDFRAMGGRAAEIRMTRCEIESVAAERISRTTGQRHSLGGFIGFAEYEGQLGEFIPYLEAARYTGVGRQTVWGKGEISIEAF